MSLTTSWHALSTRILGLLRTAQLHATFLGVRSDDTYGRREQLRLQCESILGEAKSFRSSFAQALPATAIAAIDRFVDKVTPLINDTSGSSDAKQERVCAAMVVLGAFEAELTYALSDMQHALRARSERALLHLQRSIVADEDIRRKWRVAFDSGEVECEKLGAVHLLAHGIWAFKINAAGARTDLVYQEPIESESRETSFVEGLVLTEWKLIRSSAEAQIAFEQARGQAKRYASGALAGAELAAYRYLIVVSLSQIAVPADLSEGGITYRHLNIAVEPQPPSKSKAS